MLTQLSSQKTSAFSDNPLVDIALPSVMNECLVHHFTYWNHEGLHQGMRYKNELYTLFESYSVEARLKAYTIACRQVERRLSVLITASRTGYSVWLSLRSLSQLPSSNQPVRLNP